MCSLFRSAFFIITAVGLISTSALGGELRVCADPDNLPYSNRAQQGFENKIAALLARDLHAQLKYNWSRQGRGFVRSVLNAHRCDLLLGIPANSHEVLATSPYYASTYVFVYRRNARLNVTSFDDPSLHRLRIGVQVLGEDYAPPARALARRGNITNIVGYESFGDEAAEIIRAVARRKIDIAVVWGPLAGYYARPYGRSLAIVPVHPAFDPPALPLTYAISMGVRKGDTVLHDQIAAALERNSRAVHRILASYGVPVIPAQEPMQKGSGQ